MCAPAADRHTQVCGEITITLGVPLSTPPQAQEVVIQYKSQFDIVCIQRVDLDTGTWDISLSLCSNLRTSFAPDPGSYKAVSPPPLSVCRERKNPRIRYATVCAKYLCVCAWYLKHLARDDTKHTPKIK